MIGAVITGDIIQSSKMDIEARQRVRKYFGKISQDLNAFPKIKPYIPLPIDLFKGDSWQIYLTLPNLSLRVGLLIRALLKSYMGRNDINTRMSIGIGSMKPSTERVSLGDGEAFILSGRGFDSNRYEKANLPKFGLFTYSSILKSDNSNIKFYAGAEVELSESMVESFRVLLANVDFISSNWSFRQSRAVAGALQEYDSSAIADLFFKNEISRQAVSKHLIKAGWNVIENGLSFYENQLAGL